MVSKTKTNRLEENWIMQIIPLKILGKKVMNFNQFRKTGCKTLKL